MTVSLQFLGAVGGVTGSRSLLSIANKKILIDCGLFQGPKDIRALNRVPLPVDPTKVSALVLTHAHLDHSGFTPRFCRDGFQGPIYCSEGTADLLGVMLADAAYLEEEAARFANKTGYSNHKPAIPLFTKKDVEKALQQVVPIKRNVWFPLDQAGSFKFQSAGHIIGASTVQFSLSNGHGSKLITFSGDLGHDRMLTLKAPEPVLETDTLVLESTYGDRLHPRTDLVSSLSVIAKRTFDRGGVLVIPAFAVGRSQEILYALRVCEDRGLIPSFPVILDSPMAQAATRIFMNHPEDHRDSIFTHDDQYLPAGFTMTLSSDDSMLSCMKDGPFTVISAAGMLSGGRILHHLKTRLPHEENTILFCGYQADGTKGRFLQDNAEDLDKLRIHHQEVEVNAEIATISELSAHGDYKDIEGWLGLMTRKPRKILINHGNPAASDAMAQYLTKLGYTCEAARGETVYQL
jgi:metallo-beta-lactamase family protein